MKKYDEIIYLAGLLTVLTTTSAIANESFTNRGCQGSSVQISIEDSPKNTKANNILENADAIATPAEGIASQKSTPDAAKASLWWAAEQFDPFNGKLVENWVASSQKEQIDMIVDWQLWTLLDYFDRYRFVNQFGTVARKYGYSLIIFDRQNRCLANYKYNASIRPPKWELNLENYGEDSLQVEPLQRFEELKPQL